MMTIKELKEEIENLNNKEFNPNEKEWEQEFFEISDGVYVCKRKEKNEFFLHSNDGYSDYYNKDELINYAVEMEWVEEELLIKYTIEEEWYKLDLPSKTLFRYEYSNEVTTEEFDTIKEAIEYCKKNNIADYEITNNGFFKRFICENINNGYTEFIGDTYRITDECLDLIHDNNTGCHEVVNNFYGYDNSFKIAENLFIKNLNRSDFYYEYIDWFLRVSTFECQTFYFNDEEVMTTENPTAVIDKLKELGIYKDLIEDYLSNLEHITIIKG